MNTPICDYVNSYADSQPMRLHMPGHKGVNQVGLERLDITEIDGADSLYHADGIIRESMDNASKLFGCYTYYSTEGSSQCIRAMLYLAMQHAARRGRRPVVAAARNVHSSFLTAVALLDVDVIWMYGESGTSYLSCHITPDQVRELFRHREKSPSAIYLTSPDYLGNTVDIQAISEVCKENGALLLVDNAHGAYLRFLERSMHPVDLGADICCDSAHKTLPVLTGGAYLHLSNAVADELSPMVSTALALFGSTSPSYIILQSLDRANVYMETLGQRLAGFVPHVQRLKDKLQDMGYAQLSTEPLKVTIMPKAKGYTGQELKDYLKHKNIHCEFADPDYLVLMLTPEVGEACVDQLLDVLAQLPEREPIFTAPPAIGRGERAVSIRGAVMSPAVRVPVVDAIGRILASPSVSCPPAVPILVCGEVVDNAAIQCFEYFGISHIYVIK